MDDREITPLEMLLLLAVTEMILSMPARARAGFLRRLGRSARNTAVIPIHDGDALRMSAAVRDLYDRMLSRWIAR